MPIVNEGILSELGHVSRLAELAHIKGLFENTDPLMQEMAYALIGGDQHTVDRLTRQALDDGFEANTVLDDGLISGMAIVGVKFRDNIIFVPEVLVAARAMKAGMAHVEPILSASGIEPVGIVIMGTVKGDLHDIGKNLCIMMLRGAGFVVHDLGVDTKPDEFIDAVTEHDARALGMSALLTTTMPNMGRTIEAFEEAGASGGGPHHGRRGAGHPGVRGRHGSGRVRQGRHRLCRSRQGAAGRRRRGRNRFLRLSLYCGRRRPSTPRRDPPSQSSPAEPGEEVKKV